MKKGLRHAAEALFSSCLHKRLRVAEPDALRDCDTPYAMRNAIIRATTTANADATHVDAHIGRAPGANRLLLPLIAA